MPQVLDRPDAPAHPSSTLLTADAPIHRGIDTREAAAHAPQNRGRLTEENVTLDLLESSRGVLHADRSGKARGLQQYYTPLDIAAFIASIVNPFDRLPVFDPTAGNGALLRPYPKGCRLGAEIEASQIKDAKDSGNIDLHAPLAEQRAQAMCDRSYKALHGDLQRLLPLFEMVGMKFPRIVCNPPFGLPWNEVTPSHHINGGKPCSSTQWAWEACQRLLERRGTGAFICGTRRLDDEIIAQGTGGSIYAVIDVSDLFDGVQLDCSIAFFADPSCRKTGEEGIRLRKTLSRQQDGEGTWSEAVSVIRNLLRECFSGITDYPTDYDLSGKFVDVQMEYDRRRKQREQEAGESRAKGRAAYDVALVKSRLHVNLSNLARVVVSSKQGSTKGLAAMEKLHEAQVNFFALSPREWTRLKGFVTDGLITMHPDDMTAIEAVVENARALAVPVYPIKPQQRLGYTAESETLLCTQDDPKRGFVAGQTYPVSTDSTIDRTVRTESKTDKEGYPVTMEFIQERKVLRVTVTVPGDDRTPNKPHIFNESKQDIEYLLSHFDIPDPGDIATHYPAEMESMRETLRGIEADTFRAAGMEFWGDPFRLKDYQREDVSRLLFKGGGLLAHSPGLGKTVSSMTFAEAAHRRGDTDGNALFIVPQDLQEQWTVEAKKWFGRDLVILDTPAKGRAAARGIKDGSLAPQWYMTNYEALSLGGLTPPPPVMLKRVEGERFITQAPVALRFEAVGGGSNQKIRAVEYPLPCKSVQGKIALPPMKLRYRVSKRVVAGYYDYETRRNVPEQVIEQRVVISSEDICPKCGADSDTGWAGEGVCQGKTYKRVTFTGKDGIEQTRLNVTYCQYSHHRIKVKAMGHYLSTAFQRGCIIADEGTKIQGDDSLRSEAVRGLRAKRKLLLSGTPQKSYVHQLFWLLGWCLGFNTPRFPFAYNGGKSKFEDEYCVIETQVSSGKKYKKILPEVTNLSMLWKLLSSSIVRRRKEDTGEPIVERTFIPIVVPMGVTQKKHMEKWIDGYNSWYEQMNPGKDAKDAKLGQYAKFNWVATLPSGDRDANYFGIAPDDFTPKMHKALEIIATEAAAGNRVLFGSDCMMMGKYVSDQLNGKGIPAVHIIEGKEGKEKTLAPKARGSRIATFKKGGARVLCAGVQSVALGHNLDCANVVVLAGLPWDYETLEQFLDRVHRLTSTRPVTVYIIMAEGSLDERKWKLLQDKTASAELTLDGHLIDKKQKQVSLASVVEDYVRRGITATGQIPETAVREEWRKQKFTLEALIIPPRHIGGAIRREGDPEPVRAVSDAKAPVPTVSEGDPEPVAAVSEKEATVSDSVPAQAAMNSEAAMNATKEEKNSEKCFSETAKTSVCVMTKTGTIESEQTDVRIDSLNSARTPVLEFTTRSGNTIALQPGEITRRGKKAQAVADTQTLSLFG